MGQDKALMPFLGKPLIQRVVERVMVLGGDILVITNRPDAYRFLNLPLHEDLWPGAGALGGLATALEVAHHPLVANIACDMPFVSAELIRAGSRFLERNPAMDAYIPQTEFGYEPLHAVYRRETCLGPIHKALTEGKRRMISWHGEATVHIINKDELAPFDPWGLTFWNLNTPEDFAQAESRARQIDLSEPGAGKDR